jgi:hypothetical protein
MIDADILAHAWPVLQDLSPPNDVEGIGSRTNKAEPKWERLLLVQEGRLPQETTTFDKCSTCAPV